MNCYVTMVAEPLFMVTENAGKWPGIGQMFIVIFLSFSLTF